MRVWNVKLFGMTADTINRVYVRAPAAFWSRSTRPTSRGTPSPSYVSLMERDPNGLDIQLGSPEFTGLEDHPKK